MKKTGNSSSEILRKSEVNNLIEFHCNCRHKDQTPIVSDLEIQEYAEAVLEDYKPKLLKEPGKINAVHFLESYLGATVDYQDIYYEERQYILGRAASFGSGIYIGAQPWIYAGYQFDAYRNRYYLRDVFYQIGNSPGIWRNAVFTGDSAYHV